MNKRQTEYIALYLFVFGAILLFGVLARKFVLAQIKQASAKLIKMTEESTLWIIKI